MLKRELSQLWENNFERERKVGNNVIFGGY